MPRFLIHFPDKKYTLTTHDVETPPRFLRYCKPDTKFRTFIVRDVTTEGEEYMVSDKTEIREIVRRCHKRITNTKWAFFENEDKLNAISAESMRLGEELKMAEGRLDIAIRTGNDDAAAILRCVAEDINTEFQRSVDQACQFSVNKLNLEHRINELSDYEEMVSCWKDAGDNQAIWLNSAPPPPPRRPSVHCVPTLFMNLSRLISTPSGK